MCDKAWHSKQLHANVYLIPIWKYKMLKLLKDLFICKFLIETSLRQISCMQNLETRVRLNQVVGLNMLGKLGV